jgi:hypothetical protein
VHPANPGARIFKETANASAFSDSVGEDVWEWTD